MRITTVRELKALIKDLQDETPIVSYQSDMEKSGYLPKVDISTQSMVVEITETYDAFDYTPYTYESYSMAENGEGVLCLVIN